MDRARKAKELRRARAVERQRHAVPSGAPEGVRVCERVCRLEVRELVKHHLGVAGRPHLDGRRHRRLKVRASDERNRASAPSEVAELCGKSAKLSLRGENLVLHVEPDVDCDLVVATAARM